jgi:large subunit ribosomal protein L24
MDVHRNDTVKVIAGREKGKTGKVLEVLLSRGRLRVEKLMMVKRHLKKGRSQSQPQGGIIEKEGTIELSNVMVVCPKCDKPTRVRHVVREQDGRRVRACKKCDQTWE